MFQSTVCFFQLGCFVEFSIFGFTQIDRVDSLLKIIKFIKIILFYNICIIILYSEK